MAESAALRVDEVFPAQPVRFLFAIRPAVMSKVLSIVYRCIATHLIKKAGFSCTTARTGAVTLIQRFGGALNLNVHFHMLFVGGIEQWPCALRAQDTVPRWHHARHLRADGLY